MYLFLLLSSQVEDHLPQQMVMNFLLTPKSSPVHCTCIHMVWKHEHAHLFLLFALLQVVEGLVKVCLEIEENAAVTFESLSEHKFLELYVPVNV